MAIRRTSHAAGLNSDRDFAPCGVSDDGATWPVARRMASRGEVKGIMFLLKPARLMLWGWRPVNNNGHLGIDPMVGSRGWSEIELENLL